MQISAAFGLASLGHFATARSSLARGRTPIGGRLELRLPWPISTVDPHRAEDVAAALFGDALFDTLYVARDASSFAPSLAEAEPEVLHTQLRVRLRADLRTAKGRTLHARDVAASIARSRTLGARAWLAEVPAPKVEGNSLLFAMTDASKLTRALSSPLTAVVPPTFTPEAVDGTGPMKFTTRGDAVALVRNALAARGPSYLDEVILRAAPDLAASLHAFESGTDDIGWLGAGLHEPRAGSRAFDFGVAAWAVLFTGHEAARWDAPGVAQRLCDGIPPARLSYLALGPAWSTEPEQGWGGPPTSLLVSELSPWLIELAKALAATLSRPSHEVTVKLVPSTELTQRRLARSYGLALDVVRPFAPGSLATLVALASADNALQAGELTRHPPKVGEVTPRALARTMHCGVVGEVRVQGAHAHDVLLPASSAVHSFDLAAAYRERSPSR